MLKKARKLVNLWQKDYIKSNIYVIIYIGNGYIMYTWLEKSFVIASIIGTKNNHYGESFATFEEVNTLQGLLQKKLNRYDVLITDAVSEDYFAIYDGVYVLKNITVKGLLDRYMGYFPVNMLGIYKIIFDDDFIFENIQRIRCNDRMGPYKEKELEDILNKVLSDPLVLNNPSYFFERVAKELSAEEYRHLARLISDRSCDNCLNNECSIRGIKGINCGSWTNDELVGKKKILIK